MADILSQSEIDELINGLVTGSGFNLDNKNDADNSIVKLYDFKTANRFPKEQMRTINIVMQNYVQLLANYFTGNLRVNCEIDIISLEELTFYEFNNALPSPVILAIVNAPPMEGSVLFQLSSEIADAIVNRLFGGSISSTEAKKAFTDIELAIIERVIRQMLVIFDEAWMKVIRIRSHLERIETSSQFAQIVNINEPIVVATLNVKFGSDTGVISICLPHMAVEPVAKQLNTRLWYSGTQNKKIVPNTELISRKLLNSQIDMYAVFNDTPATVKDIANLKAGDVIMLEHKVNEPITIKLQHISKFHASIGKKGSKLAVKILDVIKGEEVNE